MNDHRSRINPMLICLANLYEALLDKPVSFFGMLGITIGIYKFISIETLFIFELFSIVMSLIISLKERNTINKLLLSKDENASEEFVERIRDVGTSLAIYSIIGWTSFVIGLINLNYYLIISSLLCIYFIGIFIRRINPILDF